LIEKAVLTSWVNMEIAASPGIFDRLLESDSGADRDEMVVVA
jgi:hypothetical protein